MAIVAITSALFVPAASAAACWGCRWFSVAGWDVICIGCIPFDRGFDDCIDSAVTCCLYLGSPCDNRITP